MENDSLLASSSQRFSQASPFSKLVLAFLVHTTPFDKPREHHNTWDRRQVSHVQVLPTMPSVMVLPRLSEGSLVPESKERKHRYGNRIDP